MASSADDDQVCAVLDRGIVYGTGWALQPGCDLNEAADAGPELLGGCFGLVENVGGLLR